MFEDMSSLKFYIAMSVMLLSFQYLTICQIQDKMMILPQFMFESMSSKVLCVYI